MFYLAEVFPKIRQLKIPFSRDQLMLLLVAVNEIILGVDIYLAHKINGTIVPYEWIPIIFGPAAGVVLLAGGLIAYKNRKLAIYLATVVFFASILVGVLGSYFHIRRSFPLAANLRTILDIDLMIWAPPLFGPITFAGVGFMGLSAAWREDPVDSGVLSLGRSGRLRLPYAKTRGYLLLTSLGMMATVISSVLDHARTGFHNPWLWLPTAVGVFAITVSAVLAFNENPTRQDIGVHLAAMGLMIAVGLIGTALHIDTNLTTDFIFVQERFLRGAPFMAPLNFANMALLGLIAVMDPAEKE